MTLDQIKALNLGKVVVVDKEENSYGILNPKKPSGANTIAMTITLEHNLLEIMIIWNIKTNRFGDSVKKKFNELHEILTKKYGKGTKIDSLKEGSLWTEPQYWMMSLLKKDRTLGWQSSDIDQVRHKDISSVAIVVMPNEDAVSAVMSIMYELRGFKEYSEAVKAKEAAQF